MSSITWKQHPYLLTGPCAKYPDFPSGCTVRMKYSLGLLEPGVETILYWVLRPDAPEPTMRFAALDDHEEFNIDAQTDDGGRLSLAPALNGWSGVVPGAFVEFVAPPAAEDLAQVAEERPFVWATPELATLVDKHPRAEITRALIRSVYNAVPPGDAVTGELVAEWAKANKIAPMPRQQAKNTYAVTPAAGRRNNDYIEVDVSQNGTDYGSVNAQRQVNFSMSVEVPIDVFRRGSQAVRDYIEDYFDDTKWDVADYDDVDIERGSFESNDSEFDSMEYDLRDAMERFEEWLEENEPEEEDEDEEDEEDEDEI